jgi:integrase
MSRAPNGRSSIYQGADGKWHTYVNVGKKPDGSDDRRHIKRNTATEVGAAIDQLLERVARGTGVIGRAETVEQWLTYWLDNVIEPNRAYKTTAGYRSLITQHVIPHIGQWKLDGARNRLEPEYVETMYTELKKARLAQSYVSQIHRVLRRALKAAMRRGRAARNVCDMIDPPQSRSKKIDAHSLAEAQAILTTAMADRQPARWLLGMLLGPRQGEALGLRWHRVHLDADPPYLVIEQQLQRRTWRHGCSDSVVCAKQRCRIKLCPPKFAHGCGGVCGRHENLGWRCPDRIQVPGCSRHPQSCPPLCPAGCTDHARGCPQRTGGGLVEVDVKSEKGERDIPLPPIVVDELRKLREAQIRKAHDRGLPWDPKGLVFTSGHGQPIDPRADHRAWEKLLERAGVDDSRLHAARHTAATFMLGSGTDIRVVQAILGHSRITVTEGYVDVARELKRQAVDKVAAALMDGQIATLLQGPAVPSQRSTS